jgi:hypothetical protein
MRLIHHVPFSPQELESYRQLVFNNLTHGMKYLLDAMEDMDLKVSEENIPHIAMIENARDIRDGEPFPMDFYQPLLSLWTDPNVQKAWERGNEAALPEKYACSRCSIINPSCLSACYISSRISTDCSGQHISPLSKILFNPEHERLELQRPGLHSTITRCKWLMSAVRRANDGNGFTVFRMLQAFFS